MQSKAKTVAEYLKELPVDRRKEVKVVRKTILKNLPKGYREIMLYGMISYAVPLKIYPEGYLGNKSVPLAYAALASQKNYISVYLMNVYGDKKLEKRFRDDFKKARKELNMGKSCVRFKKVADVSLEAIGYAIAATSVKDYIGLYKASRKK